MRLSLQGACSFNISCFTSDLFTHFPIFSFLYSSESCLAAISEVSASPYAHCFKSAGIRDIAKHGASAAIDLDPVVLLLEALCSPSSCSNGQCSDKAAYSIVSTIIHGCSSVIGIKEGNTDHADVVTKVKEIYPIVRQVVCLIEWVFTSYSFPAMLTRTPFPNDS